MRFTAISVLSIFVCFPAVADVRLPVVNLSAGSVSARAAFGESVSGNVKSVAPVAVSSENKTSADVDTRRVATRTAVRTKPVAKPVASNVDTGAKIVAQSDVLSPRRPSSDLWAHSDAPLRMPNPSEFAVMRSDAALPEESIGSYARSVAPRVSTAPSVAGASVPLSEIDAQIARLTDARRQADITIKSAPMIADSAPVAAAPTVAVATPTSAPVRESAKPNPSDVKLSRLVVPMDSDVITRAVEKTESPRIVSAREDMTKLSPTELRKAFRKTFLSENKHLSTYSIDDRFDVASDMSSGIEGFTARRDLSEGGGIRPLEIKIKFRNEDSALSRDNYNLLTEYAGIVVNNPTRAIQIAIPQRVTNSSDGRKLAARRLAIVEQVLRDTGVSEQRIMPVLSQRDDEGFLLRIISNEQYETLNKKQRNMFGDTVSNKTYKSMAW